VFEDGRQGTTGESTRGHPVEHTADEFPAIKAWWRAILTTILGSGMAVVSE
jgi:hypothetical protein